jgi:hypothetical protein
VKDYVVDIYTPTDFGLKKKAAAPPPSSSAGNEALQTFLNARDGNTGNRWTYGLSLNGNSVTLYRNYQMSSGNTIFYQALTALNIPSSITVNWMLLYYCPTNKCHGVTTGKACAFNAARGTNVYQCDHDLS